MFFSIMFCFFKTNMDADFVTDSVKLLLKQFSSLGRGGCWDLVVFSLKKPTTTPSVAGICPCHPIWIPPWTKCSVCAMSFSFWFFAANAYEHSRPVLDLKTLLGFHSISGICYWQIRYRYLVRIFATYPAGCSAHAFAYVNSHPAL
jgi:hypothetical protein